VAKVWKLIDGAFFNLDIILILLKSFNKISEGLAVLNQNPETEEYEEFGLHKTKIILQNHWQEYGQQSTQNKYWSKTNHSKKTQP